MKRRDHGSYALALDLGDEPALSIAGDERGLPDRRQLSLRWLAGTFLTGFAGTALMGGALFAAVDGSTRFAQDPNPVRLTLASVPTSSSPASRKGDRLPPKTVEVQTRRIVQIATTTQVGDREIVRTRPFARVAAQLSLQRTALTVTLQPFNPLRIFADANTPFRPQTQPEREIEGEMTMVARPLSDALGALAEEDQLGNDQVTALVRQTLAAATAYARTNPAAAPIPSQALSAADLLAAATTLGFAPAEGTRIGDDQQARIVPENVTSIEKRQQRTPETVAAATDEITHIVKKGETLATILVDYGATLQESRAIIDALAKRFRPNDLKEGHRLRILTAPSDTDPNRKTIARVVVLLDRAVLATAVLSDIGQYAAVDMSMDLLDEQATTPAVEEDEDSDTTPATPSLYVAIYETALKNNVPRALIDELIRIYSYDFDFQRRVKAGDAFEVFYAAAEEAGGTPTPDDILYASLTVNGETKRFYRFRTTDDANVDFFDERGRSSKKFLIRTPIVGGTFRSGFGFRRHPLLGYTRMHTGVDWSAPVGTPIVAAGTGTVIKAEWTSGYGRRVEIQHANGYVTTYNHMNGFARGIVKGVRVTQGQVIGFLGSSGLATGPHLHYEVAVNGSYVDPMRIRVPRGRVLDGRLLAEFERERLRVDQMMRKANTPAQVARVGG